MIGKFAQVLLLSAGLSLLSACNEDGVDPSDASRSPGADATSVDAAPANVQPKVVVYKSASCGCCTAWVEHMQSHGFPVEVHNVDNLGPVKERAGIPTGMGSCHTAEVGGYFIEGHVPAAQVQRLLAEKPKAKGLTVPGMPVGSPGMEQGERIDPYDVFLVNEDGSTSVYAHYPEGNAGTH